MTVKARIFLSSLSLAVAAAALPAQAALAQAAAGITAGTKVEDTQGGEVGTVIKVEGDQLILKTDRHEVPLPVSSFTPVEGKALFGMTRDQLNAQVDAALAAAEAQIVAGAQVKGAGGAVVGTIEAVDDQLVTLKLASGASVRIPRHGVAGGPEGVVTSLTAAELEAAAGGAAAQ